MSETAFVARVPEAEALVHRLRLRHDPSAALGVPAHITVLYPFMPGPQVTPAVLARAAAALRATPAFGFSLVQVACFADTAYLAPHPAAPFVALTEALWGAFPEYPPFGGAHPSIVPHLSVGRGSAAEVGRIAAQLQAALHRHGPVHSFCGALVLLERSDSGWRESVRLPLPNR